MVAFDIGAGFPSGIFRFSAIFAFHRYSTLAEKAFVLLRDHDILQQPPFDHNILHAEQLAAKWVSGLLFPFPYALRFSPFFIFIFLF
jgi:hypothetical protein